MLQVYSNDITVSIPVDGVAFVPFNNVAKAKGCDSRLVAPGTVQIDRQGVYPASVTGCIASPTAGDYIIQLYENGVARPETLKRVTLVADSYAAFAADDLVTVQRNNMQCCCYTSPTTLQVGISAVAATAPVDVDVANIALKLTRLC